MIGNLFGIFDSELGDLVSELLSKYNKLSNSRIVLKGLDEEVEYTLKELEFLKLIQRNPGIKNIDLAMALDVTKGMVSKLVKTMEQNEVIKKSVNEDNRREIQLEITDLGELHISALNDIINDHNLPLVKAWMRLDDEAKNTFRSIFKIYNEMLEDLDNRE